MQVSTDFLRLYGNRQQFRNLLTARKKHGALPTAYTRIDASHESITSTAGILLIFIYNLAKISILNYTNRGKCVSKLCNINVSLNDISILNLTDKNVLNWRSIQVQFRCTGISR